MRQEQQYYQQKVTENKHILKKLKQEQSEKDQKLQALEDENNKLREELKIYDELGIHPTDS